MRRPLLIAACLTLVTTAVLADMYQDARNAELPAALYNLGAMARDAANAQLPAARENLELGTVKSIGGTPPDAITRFYTWDKLHPQFQINSQPESNEWTVEQGGQTGQGSTRLCWSNTSTNVDCNYAAFGLGNHVFGNGAGRMFELDYTGTAPSNAWMKFYAAGDNVARMLAENHDGDASNVSVVLGGKGTGGITLLNGDSNIASFNSAGAGGGGLFFAAAPASQPRLATIQTAGLGIQVRSQFFVMASKTANYTIINNESGTHFDNIGATGPVTITLPTAAVGRNYCFTVDAAQSLIVKAETGERIAVGAVNSASGGTVSANAPFASICLTTHKLNQWITYSTPDKAQWTVT